MNLDPELLAQGELLQKHQAYTEACQQAWKRRGVVLRQEEVHRLDPQLQKWMQAGPREPDPAAVEERVAHLAQAKGRLDDLYAGIWGDEAPLEQFDAGDLTSMLERGSMRFAAAVPGYADRLAGLSGGALDEQSTEEAVRDDLERYRGFRERLDRFDASFSGSSRVPGVAGILAEYRRQALTELMAGKVTEEALLASLGRRLDQAIVAFADFHTTPQPTGSTELSEDGESGQRILARLRRAVLRGIEPTSYSEVDDQISELVERYRATGAQGQAEQAQAADRLGLDPESDQAARLDAQLDALYGRMAADPLAEGGGLPPGWTCAVLDVFEGVLGSAPDPHAALDYTHGVLVVHGVSRTLLEDRHGELAHRWEEGTGAASPHTPHARMATTLFKDHYSLNDDLQDAHTTFRGSSRQLGTYIERQHAAIGEVDDQTLRAFDAAIQEALADDFEYTTAGGRSSLLRGWEERVLVVGRPHLPGVEDGAILAYVNNRLDFLEWVGFTGLVSRFERQIGRSPSLDEEVMLLEELESEEATGDTLDWCYGRAVEKALGQDDSRVDQVVALLLDNPDMRVHSALAVLPMIGRATRALPEDADSPDVDGTQEQASFHSAHDALTDGLEDSDASMIRFDAGVDAILRARRLDADTDGVPAWQAPVLALAQQVLGETDPERVLAWVRAREALQDCYLVTSQVGVLDQAFGAHWDGRGLGGPTSARLAELIREGATANALLPMMQVSREVAEGAVDAWLDKNQGRVGNRRQSLRKQVLEGGSGLAYGQKLVVELAEKNSGAERLTRAVSDLMQRDQLSPSVDGLADGSVMAGGVIEAGESSASLERSDAAAQLVVRREGLQAELGTIKEQLAQAQAASDALTGARVQGLLTAVLGTAGATVGVVTAAMALAGAATGVGTIVVGALAAASGPALVVADALLGLEAVSGGAPDVDTDGVVRGKLAEALGQGSGLVATLGALWGAAEGLFALFGGMDDYRSELQVLEHDAADLELLKAAAAHGEISLGLEALLGGSMPNVPNLGDDGRVDRRDRDLPGFDGHRHTRDGDRETPGDGDERRALSKPMEQLIERVARLPIRPSSERIRLGAEGSGSLQETRLELHQEEGRNRVQVRRTLVYKDEVTGDTRTIVEEIELGAQEVEAIEAEVAQEMSRRSAPKPGRGTTGGEGGNHREPYEYNGGRGFERTDPGDGSTDLDYFDFEPGTSIA